MSGIHGPRLQDNNRGSLLVAEDLWAAYQPKSPVLQGASLEVSSGSLLGILGVNGCGKSTLLSCLNGLMTPSSGHVLLNGTPLEDIRRGERAQRIAFVEQRNTGRHVTVYDELLLGRLPYLQGAPKEQDHEVVQEILQELDLQGLALRHLDELSGGELQKVMLARAFVQQTDILLLDEPTNNLDPANQHEVMDALLHMVEHHNLAAAAVLHDVNLALHYCDHFALMKEGRVAYLGGAEIMTAKNIADIYNMDCQVVEVESPQGHRHHTHKVVVF